MRSKSRVFTLLLLSALFLSVGLPVKSIFAQGAGATFLVLPIGARGVASGEAAVADTLGADASWWNPSALSALKRKEISLNGSQSFDGNSASIAFAVPSKALGTVGIAANILDYGDQASNDTSGVERGTISIRSSIAMVSYATPIGSRLRVGLSYKYARHAFTCSGDCGAIPQFVGSSSALDIGAQYVLPTSVPLTLGAAVKHIGPDFQVRDAEQADPLPRTWQIGASGRLPSMVLDSAGVTIDLMADVVGIAYESVGARLGSTISYKGKYALRGGYSMMEGEKGGPSIGLGLALTPSMSVDIARRFDGFSSQTGQTPTYVTLRFQF